MPRRCGNWAPTSRPWPTWKKRFDCRAETPSWLFGWETCTWLAATFSVPRCRLTLRSKPIDNCHRLGPCEATCFENTGHDEEALASYHRALSYQSHYPRVQLATADIYSRQKRHARALATLRTLADGYPSGETPPQVLMLQGLALKELGRYEAAAKCLPRPRNSRSTQHGNPGVIGRNTMVGRRRRQCSPNAADRPSPVVARAVRGAAHGAGG